MCIILGKSEFPKQKSADLHCCCLTSLGTPSHDNDNQNNANKNEKNRKHNRKYDGRVAGTDNGTLRITIVNVNHNLKAVVSRIRNIASRTINIHRTERSRNRRGVSNGEIVARLTRERVDVDGKGS